MLKRPTCSNIHSSNIQCRERIFAIFYGHRVYPGANPVEAKRDRVSIHGDLSFVRRIAQTKGDVIAPRVDNDDHRQWAPRRLYVIANKRRCAGSRGKFDVSRVRVRCTTGRIRMRLLSINHYATTNPYVIESFFQES